MTRMRMLILSVLALAALPVVTGAQAQQRDQRLAPQTASQQKGTAVLDVQVTTDEGQSQPIRRVSVAIAAGEVDVPHIGVTDDQGRVTFRDLAAGNYLLTASRSGYVRTFYGSAQPGRGPGVAVTVLDGQHVAGIRIRMLRGSVITGVVRNSTGRPAPNQTVQAMMVRNSGGDRRAVNMENLLGSVTTDDRGVYRIFGLAPGDYIVSVPNISFGAQDMRLMTTDELRWADKAVTDSSTAAPGAFVPPAAPAGGARMAYAPVYFPGTATVSEAQVLTLGPAEERSGVDFGLLLVPTATIKGRVVDQEGRPQSGVSLSLKQSTPNSLDLFSSLFNSSGFTGADGTFSIQGVKPGAYTLSVRATPKTSEPPAPADPAAARMAAASADLAAMGFGGRATTHWADENVNVQGVDINDLTLTLRPGMTIKGKVVYEATTKTPPADLTKTSLSLTAAQTNAATSPGDFAAALLGGGGSMPAKVAADGTFTITGIAPGRYRLNNPLSLLPIPGAGLTGGWTLKSVLASGRDIADAPIDIKPGGDVSGVVVTFTDKPSELSGTVFDGLGRVTPNFPIIVFATDRQYWTPNSRRVQTARPSSDGRFKVVGLPAGEYYVCAATAVDRNEVYDPGFLEQFVAVSFKITIADGEKKTQDLKLGGR